MKDYSYRCLEFAPSDSIEDKREAFKRLRRVTDREIEVRLYSGEIHKGFFGKYEDSMDFDLADSSCKLPEKNLSYILIKEVFFWQKDN